MTAAKVGWYTARYINTGSFGPIKHTLFGVGWLAFGLEVRSASVKYFIIFVKDNWFAGLTCRHCNTQTWHHNKTHGAHADAAHGDAAAAKH